MDINAGLIDQRLSRLIEAHADALSRGDARIANDAPKMRSRAFVALCVEVLLDLDFEDALMLLTDGGHDMGVDALHVSGVSDGEFVITLFQGKYKQRLDGKSAFPGSEVLKVVHTVGVLFDPDHRLKTHGELELIIEEARSFVREGYIPRVRVVLCNNGQPWAADGQAHIDGSGYPEDQVTFEHCNHTRVVDLLRAPKRVSDTLRLAGKSLVEEFDFRRVLVGKMAVSEVAALFERHGERLLDRNIRRYLGMNSNRVNQAIAGTLKDPEARGDFYFFNNGVTLVCNQFRRSGLQSADHRVRVDDLQVINGGQTCSTIQRTLNRLDPEQFGQTFVLVRLYEVGPDDNEVVQRITYATNSQNPVNLRDLRANDPVQQRLQMGLADLGATYLRKRGMPRGALNITPEAAAEAVLAVWRRRPHMARARSRDFFGSLYDQIFTDDLRAVDVLVATHIVRWVNERVCQRSRDALKTRPKYRFVRYAAQFIAMQMGDAVQAGGVFKSGNDVQIRDRFADWWRDAVDSTLQQAVARTHLALHTLGIDPATASLQRLAATFRSSTIVDSLEGQRERFHEEVRSYQEWKQQYADINAAMEAKHAEGQRLDVEPPSRSVIARYRELMAELEGLAATSADLAEKHNGMSDHLVSEYQRAYPTAQA